MRSRPPAEPLFLLSERSRHEVECHRGGLDLEIVDGSNGLGVFIGGGSQLHPPDATGASVPGRERVVVVVLQHDDVAGLDDGEGARHGFEARPLHDRVVGGQEYHLLVGARSDE